MSIRQQGPCPAGERQHTAWRVLALVVLVLQVGCAMGAPMGSGLRGSYHYRPLTPQVMRGAPLEPPAYGGGGSAGVFPAAARGPEGGSSEEETRERVRRVEEARAKKLV